MTVLWLPRTNFCVILIVMLSIVNATPDSFKMLGKKMIEER